MARFDQPNGDARDLYNAMAWIAGPVNPRPFLGELNRRLIADGTAFIQTDDAKRLLMMLHLMAHSGFAVDLNAEYSRLYNVIKEEALKADPLLIAVDIQTLEVGDKVTYIDSYSKKREFGRVKSFSNVETPTAFVVFQCNEDWDNYQNYTGQITDIKDLYQGWIGKDITVKL